jgi:hypothetical protein
VAHRQELDFGPPEHSQPEGVRFRLHGPGWEEWFTTVAEAPAGALSNLVMGITYDAQRRARYSAPHLVRFVLDVLREHRAAYPTAELPEGAERLTLAEARAQGLEVPDAGEHDDTPLVVVPADDADRFAALVMDKRRLLPVEQLGACAKGLAEALTNRPTVPPGQ